MAFIELSYRTNEPTPVLSASRTKSGSLLYLPGTAGWCTGRPEPAAVFPLWIES